MSTEFFRKYIDIVNENSQSTVLTEGMIQTILDKIKAKFNTISPEIKKSAVDLVTKALGKPLDQLSTSDLTIANAKKIAAANSDSSVSETTDLDTDKFLKSKGATAANGWKGNDSLIYKPTGKPYPRDIENWFRDDTRMAAASAADSKPTTFKSYELDNIPGSLEKDQKRQMAIGGTLGAIMGTGAMSAIGGFAAAATLPAAIVAGLLAIGMALLFRSSADPEKGKTGYYTTQNYDSKPSGPREFDPKLRDPRFDPPTK